MDHLWVIYLLKMVSPALTVFQCVWYTQALSITEGARRRGQCAGCGSLSVVSQLADRPGPPGAAHQRPPIHQPDRPSCWKAGRGVRRPRLALLTYETKTQCYRPASASLWCQSVLLIRKSLEGCLLCLCHLSRLPPHLLYVGNGADTALVQGTAEKINADEASVFFVWNSLKVQFSRFKCDIQLF